MIRWGQLSAAVVALCVINGFKDAILSESADYAHYVDFCWRFLIGLGAVPGAFALYFRLTLPETPRFTMDIERNVKQASADVDAFLTSGTYVHDFEGVQNKVVAPERGWADFKSYFGKLENAKVLFGCAWSWFALDVAFYGLGLNSSIILTGIGFGSGVSGSPGQKRFTTLQNVSIGNIIVSNIQLVLAMILIPRPLFFSFPLPDLFLDTGSLSYSLIHGEESQCKS